MAKGFNKGPQMGQGGMMQQLQRMQKQMEEAQAKLAEETVTATAGGGAIKVVMTGDQKSRFGGRSGRRVRGRAPVFQSDQDIRAIFQRTSFLGVADWRRTDCQWGGASAPDVDGCHCRRPLRDTSYGLPHRVAGALDECLRHAGRSCRASR